MSERSLLSESGSPNILTISETAAFLRCSKAHVCHAMDGSLRGIPRLPHLLIGRRKLIVRASLLAWMEQIERMGV
jgi:hypothetical protein